jgi:hypothetical protein
MAHEGVKRRLALMNKQAHQEATNQNYNKNSSHVIGGSPLTILSKVAM